MGDELMHKVVPQAEIEKLAKEVGPGLMKAEEARRVAHSNLTGDQEVIKIGKLIREAADNGKFGTEPIQISFDTTLTTLQEAGYKALLSESKWIITWS